MPSDRAGNRLLIGRDRELTELLGLLDDAAGGRGGLALVVGEPGIGKTYLVDAFATAAAARGAAVAWGRAWEAGGAPAYWPWIEVLRDLTAGAGDDPAAAAIACLLPELGEGMTGPAPPPLDPAQERFRLFDAVAGFLRRRGQDRPVVVIVDDLHAADVPSIALLQFAARGLRRAGIVLVGTYRDSEARLTPEIAAALAGVAREGRYLALGRLDPAEVASWLRARGDDDAELARTLHQRTEGNPLFIVETLRLLEQQRRHGGGATLRIPDGVREVIGQRLQALPAEVRALLEVASVLGRQVELRLVAAITGATPAAVREQLAPAVAADVLDGAEDRPSFSHILLREVLYGGLPAARRAELHAAVADALLLETGAAEPPLAELVHHLFAALPVRDVELAVTWARRAAERALRQLAFEDAVALYERAAAALPAGRDAERCDLLLELSGASIAAGRGAAGQAMCVDAAELARRLGDPERLARAALGYGELFMFGRVDPRLIALLEEALAGLPPGDGVLRARLLGRLAAALQPAHDPGVPIGIAREAIAMSRRTGDPNTRLAVLQSGTSALLYFAEPDERIPLNLELAELAGQLGDKVRVLRAQLRLCFDHLERGDAARADACIDGYQRMARDVGHAAYLWHAPLVRAMRSVMRGRFAEAEALADEARAIAERIADPNCEIAFPMHRIGLLRAAARHDQLAELAPLVADKVTRMFDIWYRVPYAAAVHARAGALDQARAELGRLPPDLRPSHGRLSLVWVAEVAAATGDAALAAELLPMMAPIAARNHCWGVLPMVCEGPVTRALGLAAATCGRWDEAFGHFETALQRVAPLDAPPHRARIEVEYAAALLGRGGGDDRARAAQLLDAARRTIDELDLPGLAAQAEALVPDARTAPRAAPTVPAAPPSFELRCDGEIYTVRCAGSEFHLKDSRGLQILARLIAEPEREFHVTDLLAPPGQAGLVEDAGEALDREAIAHYRERIEDLRAELAEAEDWADPGRAERARAEIEALTTELTRGTGLGGRPRRAAASSEKARVNVRRRLVDAIERIGEHSPALADHLTWAVRTGNFCGYYPAGRRGTK